MSGVTADTLEIADDALVAAQRLAEWCRNAHELEEDVALANIALDLLGQARLLLSRVGDEDELAYGRTEREFRNCLLVELPNGDFGYSIVKLLFFSTFQQLRYRALRDGDLGDIAAKALKEVDYHLDHAVSWTVRLGDGTEESHERVQRAVGDLWPYTHELFEGRWADLRPAWLATVEPVLAEATLERPADGWAPTGGRAGVHTEAMGYLLAEMQYVRRAYPGGRW